MKGQDGCQLDSKLNSKYSKLLGDPNKKFSGSIDSIHQSQFESKWPNNTKFNGQQCGGLKTHHHDPNQAQLTQKRSIMETQTGPKKTAIWQVQQVNLAAPETP